MDLLIAELHISRSFSGLGVEVGSPALGSSQMAGRPPEPSLQRALKHTWDSNLGPQRGSGSVSESPHENVEMSRPERKYVRVSCHYLVCNVRVLVLLCTTVWQLTMCSGQVVFTLLLVLPTQHSSDFVAGSSATSSDKTANIIIY